MDQLVNKLEEQKLGREEVLKMMAEVDVNNDGMVSFQEFKLFYRNIWGE
jgi:Ca2+-binding EF-hand superfamily protein